ncbi:uncharacterized protein I206_104316 [Kwoniella pini CBS 10737]|uniref:Major facilitator superfamily (MFS) profile domain-containing protein n=1 Tax=Kwoniella pini CBS 10737 TaxID=1296096 RepID=A0A1B9I261_9TREE|nr:uncharacterized protein I206_04107 [Kwoniella pini CBS 10737]OCF49585.1 hypothetical protein I206_04107 [Kwoniella pini CBS 10737]
MPDINTEEYLDIPGTIRIFDEAGHVVQTDHVNLHPMPSEDPEDPLNWSKTRKWIFLSCVIWYQFVVNLQAAVLYAIYTPLIEEKGLSLDQLNAGTGYLYLFIGIAAIFTQPLALGYGKRPIYIISTFACALLNIWTVYIPNNSQWIGSRLLLGFFLSPAYTLIQVSIVDVFFVHERSLPMSIYALAIYAGGCMGPVLSGQVYDAIGWKPIIWLSTGLTVITGFILLFFLEESSYIRRSKVKAAVHVVDEVERSTESGIHNHLAQIEEGENQDEGQKNIKMDTVEAGVYDVTLNNDNRSGQKFPLNTPWHGIRFWKFAKPHPQARAIIVKTVFQCLMAFRLPAVIWSGIVLGSFQAFYNFVSALASGILAEEPYNMSSSAVGLTFLSSLIAAIPVAFFGGPLADWYGLRCAKRNHGISEAEHKLHLWIICVILTPIGLLMMGLGPYYQAHWIVFVLGCGIINFVGTFGTLLAINYIFDCFHEIHPNDPDSPSSAAQDAAPYLLTSILICMIFSFALGYAITPWCFEWGLKNFGISSAIIFTFIEASAVIMLIWGKKMRRSGENYYRKVVNW